MVESNLSGDLFFQLLENVLENFNENAAGLLEVCMRERFPIFSARESLKKQI